MTPTTLHSRILLRSAVIAAEISSRLLNSLRALSAHVSCAPAHEAVDVRALAYSLPHADSRRSAELRCPTDRSLVRRCLPPM
jgi:hypothetical protein